MQLSNLLTCALLTGAAVAAPGWGGHHDRPPRGFVTTKGTEFRLDGRKFYFAGSNAYYFPFNNVRRSACLDMQYPLTGPVEPIGRGTRACSG